LRACRVMLRGILGDRFGQLPEELIRRIETTEDIELLQSCIRQAGRITALDQVTL
jgi:hypothetical protein